MARWLAVLCGIVLLAGCATTQEKQVSDAPKSVEKTSAARTLPQTFGAGPVRVVVKVKPAGGTAGIIVTETLPAGWTMLKATPPFDKQDGNSYKWLKMDIVGRNIAPFEIAYEAMPPEKAQGEQKFEGTVHTRQDGIQVTGGDCVISPGR